MYEMMITDDKRERARA